MCLPNGTLTPVLHALLFCVLCEVPKTLPIIFFCVNDSDLLNFSKPPVATKGKKGGPIRSRRVLSLCKKFAAFVPTQQKRKKQQRAPKPVATVSRQPRMEAEVVDIEDEAVPTEQQTKKKCCNRTRAKRKRTHSIIQSVTAVAIPMDHLKIP